MASVATAQERLVYLTELTGMRLEGPNGVRIGRVREAALAPREHSRRVSRLLFGHGKERFQIRHDQIATIEPDRIVLSDDQFVPYYHNDNYLLLEKDLLDQQIVDVNGRKVVRVNDVALRIEKVNAHEELWVHEVGVGLQAGFRRLTEGLLPQRVIRKFQAKLGHNAIPWEYCNIVEPDPQRRLKLRIQHDRLGQLHPADLADIVEELGPAEREALFETLAPQVVAEALEEVDPKIQVSILNSLDDDRAAEILDEMAPDSAADLLNALDEQRSEEILEEMEDEPAADVEELLDYDEDTAGGMMTNYFLALTQDATVGDAIAQLKKHDYLAKSLTHIFLTDEEGRLVASVPVGRLFLAAGEQPLKPLAFRETVRVDLSVDRNRVIEMFDKYNCYALPVVNELGVLSGVITADDVIAVLKPSR